MISALSEAIIDVQYKMGNDGPHRIAVSGGGPVSNQALGIAAAGVPVELFLSRGADKLVEVILREYNVPNLSLVSPIVDKKITRRIFQRVKDGLFYPMSVGRLSTTCPLCGRKLGRQELPVIKPHQEWLDSVLCRSRMLLLDRLSQTTVDIAVRANEHGVTTVLDIGTGSYLRYVPSRQIERWFAEFDIIHAPEELLRRFASDPSSGGYFKPRRALVLTKGVDGCDVLSGSDVLEETINHIPAPFVDEVVDTTGAGDALLAGAVARFYHANGNALEALGFYSAYLRSLEDATKSEVVAAISRLGARRHLTEPTANVDISEELGTCRVCNCGLPSDREVPLRSRAVTNQFISKLNLDHLENRVKHAMERKGLQDHLRSVWEFLDSEALVCYVIGTGGSYPAAVAISQLISRHRKATAIPCRPWDYVRLAKERAAVILVSYSANSGDVEAVLSVAKKKGSQRVVVLTGKSSFHSTNPVASLSDDVLSYGRRGSTSDPFPGRERGFVSMSATVAPSAVFTAAAYDNDTVMKAVQSALRRGADFQCLAARMAEASRRGGKVHIIGGGWAWPAMLDLEGKMIETDLVSVVLHETRDFSHGRFMSVMPRGGDTWNDDPVILFSAAEPDPYESELRRSFPNEKVVEISTSEDNGLGALELLVLSQVIAVRVGEDLGKDISKPGRIPRVGLELYKWKPDTW